MPPQALSEPSVRQPDDIRIAVIIPVYNVCRYLAECLDSILAQTHENFVVFAVDDGSTDGSGELLDDYRLRDTRLTVIHQKNGGAANARNTALEAIEHDGGFDGICLLDSDDCVTPDFLDNYAQAAARYEADYVVCAWDMFDKQGVVQSRRSQFPDHPPKVVDRDEAFEHYLSIGRWAQSLSKSSTIFGANVFFGAKVVEGLRYDTSLRRAEDQDFRLKALTRIHRGVITSVVTYRYRLRASSLSHQGNDFVDDIRYSLLLLSRIHEFPQSGVSAIELIVLKHWWLCICFSIKDGTFKDKLPAIDLAYQEIRAHQFTNGVTKKYRFKLFLYSLGEPALRVYMLFRKTRPPHCLDHAFE